MVAYSLSQWNILKWFFYFLHVAVVYFSTFNIFVLEYIAFHVTKFHLQWTFLLHIMEFVYPKICIIAILLLCAAYKGFGKSPIFLRWKDIWNGFYIYIYLLYRLEFSCSYFYCKIDFWIDWKWISIQIFSQNYIKFHSFYSTKHYNWYLLINHIVLQKV